MSQFTFKSVTKSLAAISFAAIGASAEAQIRYQIVVPEVLGTPINQTSSHGNEINESGETLLNRITTFAIWRDNAITHIASAASDYPASLSKVKAASINSFQEVVGTKTYRISDESGSRFDTFPFYWDPSNGIADLSDLGSRSALGAGSTYLYGINNAGLSVGTTTEYTGETPAGNTAFTWSFETGRTDIPSLSSYEGLSHTVPNAVNEKGLVVGTYRNFLGSHSVYTEQAFAYTPEAGNAKLADLAPEFFSSKTHITARDVNNSSTLVGEMDQQAYIFNLDTFEGKIIPAPSNSSLRSTKAHAINENNIVAGTASLANGASPIVWSEELGTVDLLPHFSSELEQLLPNGLAIHDTRITPKSINGKGQISATLDTNSSFNREVILEPTLDFQWTSMTQTSRGNVKGILYTHQKSQSAELIPAQSLGYQIAFECSQDMTNWNDIDHEGSAINHLETEQKIELFVPFSDCLFVRPKLVQSQN
ncbi:hypothetical protein [Pelagicoccus mobilis]|uniref:Uncharacterized protein n=1 Tax=Pelagicoccus mobilis TaxID=415221 RepID=A0A934RY77_9BACT|nr:hypothetical protein [Pelagicoccus mobilis]MBK1877021.1 hypothetical protein [Pelagicoccus mobilis]